jgi:flagellar hook-length control protein FliK
MLTINPSALRAPAPEIAPAPAPTGHGPSDPAGFSSLLRQSRVAVAPPPHEDTMTAAKADPAPEAEASPEANDTQATDTAAPARAAPKAKLRSSDAAAHAAKPGSDTEATQAKPAEPSAVSPDQAAPTAPATPTTPLDPNVAQWLAAQQRPVITAKAGDAALSADPTTSALGDASTGAKTTRPDGAALDTDAKDKTGRVASRFAAAAETAGLNVAGATGAATRTTEATPSSPAPAAAPAGSLLASPSLQTPQAPREAGTPTPVTIATLINAPDFAQTLGVQLSVLAKGGIQQAELHLNPAEMGPVSVQIVMEGTQARIDFGADLAATRHAIEAGLPELASALRDAGFTLAGGGVSQHSGQRSDGRQGGDRGTQRGARVASDEAVARVAMAARRIVTPGGVDLYA